MTTELQCSRPALDVFCSCSACSDLCGTRIGFRKLRSGMAWHCPGGGIGRGGWQASALVDVVESVSAYLRSERVSNLRSHSGHLYCVTLCGGPAWIVVG